MGLFKVQTVELEPGARGVDPQSGQFWYPPGAAERANVSLRAGELEGQVVGASGQWANCALYFQVPNAWKDVVLSLRQRVGQAVVELERIRILDVPALVSRGANAGIEGLSVPGTLEGLAFAMYGLPAQGNLFVVADNASADRLTGGQFWLRCWGTEGNQAGARVARPVVDRWGGRQQELDVGIDLLSDAAPQTLFAAATTAGRAVHLTELHVSTDDPTPFKVTLQQRNVTAAATNVRGIFWVSSTAPVAMNYSYPLTGLRGYDWEIIQAGGVVNVSVQAVGFEA